MKTVFVNPERCIGCRQCEFACAVEHSASRDPVSAVFESIPPRSRIHVMPGRAGDTSFPNRCRHCNPAPCERVCPTGAITRDPEYDLVMAAPQRCIACAMCAMVCPFDAITFHEQGDGIRALESRRGGVPTEDGEVGRCGLDPEGSGEVEDVKARYLGSPDSALGILGMKERAVLVGGLLAVDSKPGAGTTIRVQIALGDE